MKKIGMGVLVFVLLVPALALADGPATVPVAPEATPWWTAFLSSDAVWNVVGVAITFLIGLLGKIAWVKDAKAKVDAETLAAIEAGVIKTYYDSVKTIKASAADRKITPDEAAMLRAEALENAKAIAVGPAKDALIQMAKPTVDALIERILGNMKRTNSTPPEHDTSVAGDAK